MRRSAIRHLLLDGVGTLIYPEPPVDQVYWEVARRHGSALSREGIQQRFREAFSAIFRSGGTEAPEATSARDEYELWQLVVSASLEDVRDAGGEPFRELWEHFANPSAWRLYPDVMPTLTALRPLPVTVSVASNFDERLLQVLRGLGVTPLVTHVFFSSQLGYAKPDVRFYEAILEVGQVPAEATLMVGDDLELDVQAARNAGMHAILLERSRGSSEPVGRQHPASARPTAFGSMAPGSMVPGSMAPGSMVPDSMASLTKLLPLLTRFFD